MNAALTRRPYRSAVNALVVLLALWLMKDLYWPGTWFRHLATAPDPVQDILFNWKGWLLFAVMALASAQGGLTASARERLLAELGEVKNPLLTLLVLAPLPFLGMEEASLPVQIITLFLLLGLVVLLKLMAALLVNPGFSDTLSDQRTDMMNSVGPAFFGMLCLLAFCISGHPDIQLAITSACVLYITCALPLLLAVVFARLRLGIHWLHERGARTFLALIIINLSLLISLSAPEDALPNPVIVAGIELLCLLLIVAMAGGAILAPAPPWEQPLRTHTAGQGRQAEVDRPYTAYDGVRPVDESSLAATWLFGFGLLWFIWAGNGVTADSPPAAPAATSSAPAAATSVSSAVPAPIPAGGGATQPHSVGTGGSATGALPSAPGDAAAAATSSVRTATEASAVTATTQPNPAPSSAASTAATQAAQLRQIISKLRDPTLTRLDQDAQGRWQVEMRLDDSTLDHDASHVDEVLYTLVNLGKETARQQLPLGRIRVHTTALFDDRYGNAHQRSVMRVTLPAHHAGRINWERISKEALANLLQVQRPNPGANAAILGYCLEDDHQLEAATFCQNLRHDADTRRLLRAYELRARQESADTEALCREVRDGIETEPSDELIALCLE
ncbi:MAG: hypothetical protein Q4E06_09350 [Lautropia sp.]|nr:hypothetical protein [Lautropia sp.]